MESFLEMLGLLFFMFLVLGACVEVIIEVFRGFLEWLGFNWAKSKISLDEALKLADEFAPQDKELHTKLQAVRSAALQLSDKAADKIRTLEELEDDLADAGVPVEKTAASINAVATDIKNALNLSDRTRMIILRAIAGLFGCFLIWQSKFYVFQILANSPSAAQYKNILAGLQDPWINVVVGGLAAAAGSSYWHDQLDRIRSLKSVSAEMKRLGS